ncbi:hypothetical protein [Rhizobium straminoryzae]|uniref:Major capsid protein n=1 Tax=Rhizobium straminoryzae TaxID=1387186 RepID=A0A549TGJ9_9HYPH|nr:hypothetical protein [Rhizobium straminoryzae]TRL41908.1 hypothetical protein FNA46_03305 [Rhizobium straminoryzae]
MNVSAADIKALARTKTTPIPVQRSTRQVDIRALTSLPAGKMVPIAAFPLLREDRLRSSQMRISFELMETVEILMNAVNVAVKAYLVPNVAFERFSGFDELNRAYEGIPNQEGGPVTPYIETMVAGAYGSIPIHKYLGFHAAPTDNINTAYIEAYNQIWNFRAKNRSKGLALRSRLQTDLATAFWQHDSFRHIVPDFDQAVIDGQVALNVVNSALPVKGIGIHNSDNSPGGATATYKHSLGDASWTTPWMGSEIGVKSRNDGGTWRPDVFAELQANGITVSLSNIELARKTQAFAELRKQYGGHDNYIIDLLMDGITIPEQQWRQPILLADKTTVFGVSKRYATDGGNLTDSVVSGATFVDLNLVTPVVPCGGVIMIVAEITPEQLFERQRDTYLHTTTVSQLPQYLRDTLDPEKVDIVKNGEMDTSHATPNGAFGYAPLNWAWSKSVPQVGGRFFRPAAVTTFDEDRQRIWAVETANPTLGPDFYLCNGMHTKPFVVTNQDIGESLARGVMTIDGLTVFGGALVEANGDYAEVLSEAPQTRIVKA